MISNLLRGLFLTLGLLAAVPAARAAKPFIIVASTSSTQNSGLFDHIFPIFQKHSGIEVRVLAVGTGQAIRLAQNGDADVLLVHHKPSEEKFVAEGFGVERFELMYNDFDSCKIPLFFPISFCSKNCKNCSTSGPWFCRTLCPAVFPRDSKQIKANF